MSTAHHRPARRRPAFQSAPTVTVRCPRCRKRLAEVWPVDHADGPGWDGMVYATVTDPEPFTSGDPSRWTCPRCDLTRPVDDRALAGQLAAASGPRPEVKLGDRPVPASLDW